MAACSWLGEKNGFIIWFKSATLRPALKGTNEFSSSSKSWTNCKYCFDRESDPLPFFFTIEILMYNFLSNYFPERVSQYKEMSQWQPVLLSFHRELFSGKEPNSEHSYPLSWHLLPPLQSPFTCSLYCWFFYVKVSFSQMVVNLLTVSRKHLLYFILFKAKPYIFLGSLFASEHG